MTLVSRRPGPRWDGVAYMVDLGECKPGMERILEVFVEFQEERNEGKARKWRDRLSAPQIG